MSSLCIPRLPIELAERILEYVDSTSTLASIALCSREWNKIAIPYLYRKIDIRFELEILEPHEQCKLVGLTLTLLRNPKFAVYVKHFTLTSQHSYNRCDREVKPKGLWTSVLATLQDPFWFLRNRDLVIPGDQGSLIKDAFVSFSQLNKQNLWLGSKFGRGGLLTYLLVVLLPKLSCLETLEWEIHHEWLHTIVQALLHESGREGHKDEMEPKYRKLGFFYKNGGWLTPLPFLFPSTKEILLFQMTSDTIFVTNHKRFEPLREVQRGSSACTHLEMRACMFVDDDIKAILSIPACLSTLIYEMKADEYVLQETAFEALRSAIEIHRDTLENLWLSYQNSGLSWYPRPEDNAHAMDSLKNFHSLRRLRIAPDFIFGVDIEGIAKVEHDHKLLLEFLPRSIETLHITHTHAWGGVNLTHYEPDEDSPFADGKVVYEAMEHLLNHKAAELPCLMEIILDTSLPAFKQDMTAFQRLFGMARANGVRIVVRSVHGHETYSYEDRDWGMDEDVKWKFCDSHWVPEILYDG
ncbi:hypothetical protein B0J11DRAFT_564089 [Dendryphion nanum]|uniref:F-box domain-containing protein n=1 Tax=Dendryphion nanum TaxID=256645 RepID=A0A9P9ELM4_9PLEO|nr:hypothetical protein B0J11DRAFT_564089 [Dendryphion nanum]